MPSRHQTRIDTGIEVEIPEGYRLCFSLVSTLLQQGLIALNAPGRLTSGKVQVDLLNSGRSVVTLRDGDPLLELWMEKNIEFHWEKLETK